MLKSPSLHPPASHRPITLSPQHLLPERVLLWPEALIVVFRSIMGLMMSAGEASQISRGASGGWADGEKRL